MKAFGITALVLSCLGRPALGQPVSETLSESLSAQNGTTSGPFYLEVRGHEAIEIQASESQLFGGLVESATSAYCPPGAPAIDCSGFTSQKTVIQCQQSNGVGTQCSLAVAVAGGQELYVEPGTGLVKYTAPHHFAPGDAITDGFFYSKGNPGLFNYVSDGKLLLKACPMTSCQQQTDGLCFPFVLKVALEGVDVSECKEAYFRTIDTEETAYEYL